MFDLILLIDDSEADNFFHKIVIEQANCAKEIISMTNAQDALEFLNTPINGKYPQPA